MQTKRGRGRGRILSLGLACWLVLEGVLRLPLFSLEVRAATLLYSDRYAAEVMGEPTYCGAPVVGETHAGGKSRVVCAAEHVLFYYYQEFGAVSARCEECGFGSEGGYGVPAVIRHIKETHAAPCPVLLKEAPKFWLDASIEVYSDGKARLEWGLTLLDGEGEAAVCGTMNGQSLSAASGVLETQYTANGDYTASIYYSDDDQREFSFTIDTLPITVSYDEPEQTVEMWMGQEPETVETLSRYGYHFDGYTDEQGRKAYRADGTLASHYIQLGEMEKSLRADWRAKQYVFSYTAPEGGASVERQVTLTYGEALPELELDGGGWIQDGKLFYGYDCGDQALYDCEGKPLVERLTTELDELTAAGGAALVGRWEQIDLYLYYGEDADGDGRADHALHIVGDQDFPTIHEHPEREGELFAGWEYDGTLVFQADGTPEEEAIRARLAEWMRSGAAPQLSERWEGKRWELRYGADADGDGQPDGRLELGYGEALPPLVGMETPEDGTFQGWGIGDVLLWDAEGNPVDGVLEMDIDRFRDDEGQLVISEIRREAEADGDGKIGTGSGGKAGGDGGSGSGEDDGDDDDDASAAGSGQDAELTPGAEESVSQNSVSQNGAVPVSISPNGASRDDDGGEDASESDGEGLWIERRDAVSGREETAERPTEDTAEAAAEEREETPPEEDAVGQLPPIAVQILPAEGDRGDASEDAARPLTEEERRSAARKRLLSTVLKTAAAVAVTGGTAGALLGAYMGLVYLTALIEICCIQANGRANRLGRLTIRSAPGKAFRIQIPQSFIDRCETGRLRIRIPWLFALCYRRRELIVDVGKSSQTLPLRRVAELRIEG